jgi:beta-glucanase (GH16 family)
MFKSKYLYLVLALVLAIGTMTAPIIHAVSWSDDFNGSAVDTNKWVFETGGGGWGNNELEYYKSGSANTSVSGGILTITAKKESYGGCSYTSARMKTQGKFSYTYGTVEARLAVPQGKGYWPACWMLGNNIGSVGWPKCGEIDVMESINSNNTCYGTMHWDNNGHASYGGSKSVSNMAGWHTYKVVWTTTAIKWYVDGSQYWEGNIANGINGTDEFSRPFFILLNFAVGGNWPGNPDSNTVFPAYYKIDYIHVY